MTTYKITCDGVVIHDSRFDDVRVSEPTCDFAAGASGRMNFDLLPGNPAYSIVHKLTSEITLWVDDEWAFSGRVLNDEANFLNVKKIEVEGELGYLNDSIVRPYLHQDDIRPLLEKFVADHNAQVGPERRFTVGLVTVTDPNGYIYRESAQYPDTWSEMADKLPKLLGGYLRTRRGADGVRYLDYVETYGNVNDQVVRFGENLLDLDRYTKGEDVATALIPLGAQNDKTDRRLTIASVNGGRDFIFDQEAVDAYGWIFQTVVFDDVTLAPNLLTKAHKHLADQRLLGISLEVNAVDLSLIDVEIERFKIGDLVRVVSPPHGLDDYLMVSTLHLDLEDPRQSHMELGATRHALTDESAADSLAPILDTYDKRASVNQKIDTAKAEVTAEMNSSISQSANEIILQVTGDYVSKTELRDVQDVFQSQIDQTDRNVLLKFVEAHTETERVEGVVVENQRNLEANIRFSADGIELGRVGSEFVVKLSNTELAFMQSGQKVAYVSNNQLYITDAEVKNNLALGTPDSGYFDFVPRTNGNMSFKFRS